MIFDNKSLNDALTKALTDSGIPDDHKNAFAIVATTSGGVKGVLTTKVNNVWQIDSVVSVNHDKKVDAGVQVKATW